MKKISLFVFFIYTSLAFSQVVKDYNPSIQRTKHLQYFKPVESHLFSGDGMPYYYNGTLYLYWLLDEGHHAGLGGLGGHQWALSTTEDLINWKHYPVALGIDNEEWEKSICTGSVIVEDDKFYAFYATRVKEGDKIQELLSYAVSTDKGVTYKKQEPNPFYLPPAECIERDFRDPKVFKDDNGLFHLFISGNLKEPRLKDFGGYLVHLTSTDLKNWKEVESPLKGQRGTPECSDYFKWNDWYYLLYSISGHTYYLKSKNAFGPWIYPKSQSMVEYFGSVYKTAEFKDNRRIAVAYAPYRRDNKDDGDRIWGGNILFRELHQENDGTLSTKFLNEVLPQMSTIKMPNLNYSSNVDVNSGVDDEISINALGDIGVVNISGLPKNYRIQMEIDPLDNYEEIGLLLRASEDLEYGYKLVLNPNTQTVLMHNTSINAVENLDESLTLDVIVYDEFFDVSVNNERCILNRLPEHTGENLFIYVKNGSAKITNMVIMKI